MSNEPPSKQVFPESRILLFIFSPSLGAFFLVCACYVHSYEPTSAVWRVGKALVLEVVSTFLTLSVVGFIASIVGPDRMRPLINWVGGKAALAGVLLMVSFLWVLLYYVLTS